MACQISIIFAAAMLHSLRHLKLAACTLRASLLCIVVQLLYYSSAILSPCQYQDDCKSWHECNRSHRDVFCEECVVLSTRHTYVYANYFCKLLCIGDAKGHTADAGIAIGM